MYNKRLQSDVWYCAPAAAEPGVSEVMDKNDQFFSTI